VETNNNLVGRITPSGTISEYSGMSGGASPFDIVTG
jgi:hypothetical protein